MKGVVDGEAEEAPALSSLLGQLSSQRVSKARCSLSHCFSACHISSSLSCESRLSHHAVIIIFIVIATAAATASIAKTNVAKTMVAIFGRQEAASGPITQSMCKAQRDCDLGIRKMTKAEFKLKLELMWQGEKTWERLQRALETLCDDDCRKFCQVIDPEAETYINIDDDTADADAKTGSVVSAPTKKMKIK
jgi:hypothetical protein